MTTILEEVLLDMMEKIEDNRREISRLRRREGRPRTINSGVERELTIAAGVITVRHTDSNIIVDTESDAGTDDLDTINGGHPGQVVIFASADDAREPTFKDGTGNMSLAGDFLLDNDEDTIVLQQKPTGGGWKEISRSNNL